MNTARGLSIALTIAGEIWLVRAVPAVLVCLTASVYLAGFVRRRASPGDFLVDAAQALLLPVISVRCVFDLLARRYRSCSGLPVARLRSAPTSR